MQYGIRLVAVIWILQSIHLWACTSAIISGRVTADGRPILWKHRDSNFETNKVMVFQSQPYSFIGVVNTADTTGNEIWMGSNSAGFCIINTASYNLNQPKDYKGSMDQEGILMKQALETCADLTDFEALLGQTRSQRGVEANFGVIDAKGGAAYYETSIDHYEKFDVNDPHQAPLGYMIRTNFSISGDQTTGYGYIRYQTTQNLFFRAKLENRLNLDFIVTEADRCLQHFLQDTDLMSEPYCRNAGDTHYILFRDYIVRNSSVSSMIIQGVIPGENPNLTTLWTILGFPLTTPVIPLWVEAGKQIPVQLMTDGAATPLLNQYALELKKRCFPITIENGSDYLNIAVVLNREGDGYLQRMVELDRRTMESGLRLVQQWRDQGFRIQDTESFYRKRLQDILAVYRQYNLE
ncbi:MAG: hypothetical protein KBA26_13940 [Candidatus Delongbacteria bacterium]|nr:hypothetical protein [Candidatus Delongbacteria bacterium]